MLDDALFTDLLDRYHGSEGAERERLEGELIQRLDVYFRDALRPGLAHRFGRQLDDTSVRYTAMANDFFAKVLDRRPDAFWRARTLQDLRRWTSRVISNQILTVLRRRRGLPRAAAPDDPLEDLADQRAAHFEQRHRIDLAGALEVLEGWHGAPEPWPLLARVIEHRYIDGMNYSELEVQLGLPRAELYRLRDAAIAELRRRLA